MINVLKITISILTATLFLNGCIKGDDYCKPPVVIKAIYNVKPIYNVSEKIEVNLEFINSSETDLENALYSFSVPSVFTNLKGNYPTDVVDRMNYSYTLKDTLNPPASVTIEAYSFNDCGRSATVTAIINFQ